MELQQLLTETAQRKASDLHLKPASKPILRIHGHLEVQDDLPLITREFIDAMAKTLLGERRLNMLMEGREMDLGYMLPGIGRFRCNLFLAMGEVRGVFRHVPERIPAFHELHLPKVLERLSMERRGMILVTGITGSGKSTALAAMINHVNQNRRVNVITIEDPIEFLHRDVMSNISQREVGSDTLSFASALRHVLRQDPDVILVGEIRDMETLDTALKAADTGHLVFSTLHTTDATQTLNRIISFYPPHQHQEIRMVLATALQGVVSLRLVPRADGRGRVPAAEVLVNTAAVADNIRDIEKALNIPDLIAEGTVSYGMQSFDQSLMKWYKDGAISYESALFYSTNPNEFALRISGVDSASDRKFDDIIGDQAPKSQPADLTP
jgi:twitching motility protein PilT